MHLIKLKENIEKLENDRIKV